MKNIIVNNWLKNMPTNRSEKTSDETKSLRHRIDELESLLNVNQVLSNIYDPMELYSALSGFIREKFEVRTLAIFVYHHNTKNFESVFSHGLDDLVISFNRNDGPLWQEILRKDPFPVNDISGNPIFPELLENHHLKKLRSELWVPFVMRNKVIGLLTIGKKGNDQSFDEFDLNYIKHIANHASTCLNAFTNIFNQENEKKELNKILQNFSYLLKISRAMTHIGDLKDLLKYIMTQALEITKAEKGSIMLYNHDTDQLSVSIIEGLADKSYQEKINNKQVKCKSFKPGEGVAGRVLQTAEPIILNDIQGDEQFIEADSSFTRSIACLPIVVYKDVIGVINVTNKRDETHFSEVDLVMLKAITDQAALAINKAQLLEMAVTDFLTGLYIRRYFLVRLQDELYRAERHNKVFSVIMADIDKFKNVNDMFGHSAGDRVLKEVGKFLQKNMRQEDLVARYGGEEFVIFLPETDKKAAYILAERLRKKFSQIKLDNFPNPSISMGIATFPEDGKDIESLINNADTAMYTAKGKGRNQVVQILRTATSVEIPK
jgi:diguanylate cyclase (GGDEF)-like protein